MCIIYNEGKRDVDGRLRFVSAGRNNNLERVSAVLINKNYVTRWVRLQNINDGHAFMVIVSPLKSKCIQVKYKTTNIIYPTSNIIYLVGSGLFQLNPKLTQSEPDMKLKIPKPNSYFFRVRIWVSMELRSR